MPPLLRAWPISGSLGVASGSTSRSPSKPPSPVVARPPSRVRQPSRPPPCGSTTDRHQAAPRQDARATSPEDRVSGSLPMRRCGGAYRQEPRALRHYNGRAIVRSIVRQTPSSPILARWCDHAPVARSPESAVTSWHPEIQHTVLPAPPHSNACRPSPCVQSPDSWRSSLSASQGRVNPPCNVESISRKPHQATTVALSPYSNHGRISVVTKLTDVA